MGLLFGYGSRKNKKLVESVLKQCKTERKMVTCPRCRTRSTVTFLGSNDSYTCRECGYKIYADEV